MLRTVLLVGGLLSLACSGPSPKADSEPPPAEGGEEDELTDAGPWIDRDAVGDIAVLLEGCSVHPGFTELRVACENGHTFIVSATTLGVDAVIASVEEQGIRSERGRWLDTETPHAVVLYRMQAGEGYEGMVAAFESNTDDTLLVYCHSEGVALDEQFCAEVITAYIYQEIPEVFVVQPEDAHFAGRSLNIGERCQELAPRNLKCESGAQLSWEVTASAEEASAILEESRERTIQKAKDVDGGVVIARDERVPCRFESFETICVRLLVDFRALPDFPDSDAGLLEVVMASGPVRDENLFAACSFYRDQVPPGAELAPLCAAVMALDE